ncbi:MAG TPA: YlbF family regulator [Limnochordia bacterium]|nr:YlbF family regulator [Limnochordia bacterium]
MNQTVQQRAEALAAAIQESEELAKLKEARATIEQHESAKIMLRDLARVQEQLQRKQLSGQQLTETEVQRFQEMSVVAGSNPFVRKLLEAEYAFSEMMMAVQDALSAALGDEEAEADAAAEPDAANAEDGGAQPHLRAVPNPQPAPQNPAPNSGRSKLWTPRG